MSCMGLADTIQSDLVAAMKAGDDVKKTTLRAVLTAVKTAETADGAGDQLSDEQVLAIIASEVKQRNEAAEIFVGAGETARYQNEIDEREVLQTYLPEPLTADELNSIVADVVSSGGYTTKKDMGAAIKEVMAKAAGRADGRTVSAAVGEALS